MFEVVEYEASSWQPTGSESDRCSRVELSTLSEASARPLLLHEFQQVSDTRHIINNFYKSYER